MKKLFRVLMLLLLVAVLVLPCYAEEILFEDTVTVSYMRHGRNQKQEVPFRTNVQDGQEVPGHLLLQVETDADVFVYLNGTSVPYEKDCRLSLQRGENTLKLLFRTANGMAEKSYTIHSTVKIPEGKYFDALSFCVEQGILTGDESGNLRPEASATRAEVSAMLSRFLGLQGNGNLADYRDVEQGAWYVPSLSACAKYGLITGTDKGMEPSSSVTRQQAMVILARAFGLQGDEKALAAFPDAAAVSPWAKSGTAAMAHGILEDALRPRDAITRQELAGLFFSAVQHMTNDPAAIPAAGTVLYTGTSLPKNLQLDGNIVLTAVEESTLDLTDWQVTGGVTVYTHGTVVWDDSIGCLSLRGSGILKPQNTAKAESLLSCTLECDSVQKLEMTCGGTVLLQGTVSHGNISAESITVAGTAETLFLHSSRCIVEGTVNTASFPTENCSVTVTGSIAAANFTAKGAAVRIDGTMENAIFSAEDASLSGSGKVGTVTFQAAPKDISISCQNIRRHYDTGLMGVVLTQFGEAVATPNQATVSVAAKISGVDTQHTYGVPGGVRTVKAEFILDGQVVGSKDVHLKEGAVVSAPIWFSTAENAPVERTVVFRLTYGTQTAETKLKVQVRTRSSFYDEAKTIKTIWVEATADRDLPLYKGEYLTNPTGYVIKKGEVVSYIRNHGSSYKVKVADGTVGFASPYGLKISDKVYTTNDVTYSIGAREAFVNELHDYASPTKYLLWLNLYTETVTVFEGSQGNWKFLKDCRSSSGKNISPTRPGVYYIYSRTNKWTFDNNYYYVTYPSLFDGGIAFHSRTYLTNGGGFLDSRLGMTISHGCVRIPDDMAKWIYDNCAPGKTTVVVY